MKSDTINFKLLKEHINHSIFEKMHILIHLVFYIALVMNASGSVSINQSVVSVAIAIYFLLSSPQEHFYFLIGFVPFELLAKVGDISFYFIFLLISSIKLMVKNIEKGYSQIGIVALMMLATLEAFGDLRGSSMGAVIVNASTILYFVIFVMQAAGKRFTLKRILINFYISYFTVVGYVISGYGSLKVFLDKLLEGNILVRFGHEEAIAVGGAMGIPLYSALLIAMTVSYYITKNKMGILEKALLLGGSLIAFAVGSFTISRSFLLCMAALFVMLFVSLKDKKRKQVAVLLLVIAVMGVFVYIKNIDLINRVLKDFIDRSSNDSGLGSRAEIWGSCFDYLFDHPIGLLIGYGINRYSEIGENLDLLFSAKTHNLYLDVIMSIGVLGFISLYILINIFKRKLSQEGNIKATVVSTIPIVVLLTFGLTALTLGNLKTWIYILMTIIFIYKASSYTKAEEVLYDAKRIDS